jgi:hypothetical protein
MDFIYGALGWLLANILWDCILVGLMSTAVSTAFFYFKNKQTQWTTPLLYALVGFTCTAALCFSFLGMGYLIQQQNQTSTEYVEKNVRAWLESEHYAIQTLPRDDATFSVFVILNDGVKLYIRRMKNKQRILYLDAALIPEQKVQDTISNFSSEQLAYFMTRLHLTMAEGGTGYGITKGPQGFVVGMTALVPVYGLTDESFDEQLEKFDNRLEYVRQYVSLLVDSTATQPHPALSQ